MNLFRSPPWINLLALLPGTSLTLLTIAVAFLRFYNEQDFRFLGYLAEPRIWSNRLTVAALVVAVVNFGVEWNLRNRETDRLAQEEQQRAEARERAARQARIQNRWTILQVQYQLDPREQTRAVLADFVVFLQEYGE